MSAPTFMQYAATILAKVVLCLFTLKYTSLPSCDLILSVMSSAPADMAPRCERGQRQAMQSGGRRWRCEASRRHCGVLTLRLQLPSGSEYCVDKVTVVRTRERLKGKCGWNLVDEVALLQC